MLKSITLTNYRSHENITFDLHPGVNVIVGRGQSGKTNVMRAFDTARTNRPLGFRYHSRFAGKQPTEIKTETVEGDIVKFTKDANGAMYTTEIHRGTEYDVEELRKIGTKVPPIVTQLLNMGDLNMQWQHDSPYLITGSVGKIGKAINAVINFEEIDEWLKTIAGKRSDAKTQCTALKSSIEDTENNLARLPDIKAAGDLIAAAEQEDTLARTALDKHIGLTDVLNNINRANDEMEYYAPMLEAERAMQDAEGEDASVRAKLKEISWLKEGLKINVNLALTWDDLQVAKTRLWEATQQLGDCPMCGQPITTKAHLEHILEAL